MRAQDALDLLGSVQEKIAAALAAAPDDPSKQTLRELADRVSAVGRGFVALQGEFDRVTAALRARLNRVEQWFDTVMQSFDERYARGMKTWGLVVAFLVVAALNADFFQIYNAISGNERLRQHILDQSAQVGRMARKVNDLTQAAQATADAGKPDQSKAIVASIDDTVKADAGQIDQAATVYAGMGFQPLGPAQVARWWRGPWTLDWLRRTGSILLGWIVMTLLMSAGAPFWEDALESPLRPQDPAAQGTRLPGTSNNAAARASPRRDPPPSELQRIDDGQMPAAGALDFPGEVGGAPGSVAGAGLVPHQHAVQRARRSLRLRGL